MNGGIEPQTPSKSGLRYWVGAVLIAGVGTVAAHFVGLWLEYYVFNPGDQAAQAERTDRILALTPWSVVVFVVILLTASVCRAEGRDGWARFWDALKRCGCTVRGLRPRSPYTSHRSRTAEAETQRTAERAKYDEGFTARSAEVEAERKDARRYPPSFRVEKRENPWHKNEFTLYNQGWKVGNVWLTAPEDEFTFDGDPPVWSGDFGDDDRGGSIGKCFYGDVTEKGLANGVTFKVAWSWRNLDRDDELLWVDPSHLVLPPDPEQMQLGANQGNIA